MSPLVSHAGFKPVSLYSSQDSLQEPKSSGWYDDARGSGSQDFRQGPESGAFESRPVQAGHPALDLMRIACILSHLAIIGFLLFLVSLRFPEAQHLGSGLVFFTQFKVHAEDSVTTDNFLRSAAAQLFVSNSKLIFGSLFNGYAIILVLTTQKLALRRQLHIHNSLTTKHDTVSAWSGLGSAVMTIFGWRQIGFRTSLTTTFIATGYLATILAFQTLGSNMVSFTSVNTVDRVKVNTTGLPDFTKSTGTAITGSSSLLTIRSLENFINFTGLANNGIGAVYNIPVDREGFNALNAQVLNVSATYFNVECGTIPGNVVFDATNSLSTFRYNFVGDSTPLPSILSNNMISVTNAPWGIAGDGIDTDMAEWPPTLLILSTVPVFDSLHQAAVTVPVSPPMNYTPSGASAGSGTTRTVSQVVALGCNLTLETTNAMINPRTFGLQEPSDLSSMNKSSSTLRPFPISTRGVVGVDAMDSLLSTWPFLPQVAVSPLSFAFNNQCKSDGCFDFFLSETDQFVMESLSVFPDMILQNNEDTAPSIKLHDLENVLSRMTAISVWSQAWGSNQKFVRQLDQVFGDTESSSAIIAPVYVDVARSHRFLTVNLRQLYATFVLSILLLALAAPAILDTNNLKIDSIGILQMIWLLHEHPEVQNQIARVENPTSLSLREAGQSTNVCFGEHHHPTLPKGPSQVPPC